jgi:hypothetical protein
MKKKNLWIGMFGMVLTFGFVLTGCASATYIRTDPFLTNDSDEDAVIVRVMQGTTVTFNNDKGENLKVDGMAVSSNEFSLPIGPSYEFKFRAKAGNRLLIGLLNTIVGRANVSYAFEQGKNYIISIEETAGSRVGAVFLGGFMPASFKIVIYECSSDWNKKTRIKREEFPVEKLEDNEF